MNILPAYNPFHQPTNSPATQVHVALCLVIGVKTCYFEDLSSIQSFQSELRNYYTVYCHRLTEVGRETWLSYA